MKRRILLSWISIIGYLFSITVVDVYANGVPTPDPRKGPYETIVIIFIMFIIAVEIEYRIFTYSKFEFSQRSTSLFYTFLKINFITFPLTQILAYIVYIYSNSYYWYYILGIEILVVLAEWRLILIEFKKKYTRVLHSMTTLKILILTNFISFFLGFVPYIVIFLFTEII